MISYMFAMLSTAHAGPACNKYEFSFFVGLGPGGLRRPPGGPPSPPWASRGPPGLSRKPSEAKAKQPKNLVAATVEF